MFVLNTGALVGELAEPMDVALGQRSTKEEGDLSCTIRSHLAIRTHGTIGGLSPLPVRYSIHPAQKVKTLDIPGGDGVIDASQALTGYPVYQNRTGSIEFIVMNDFKPWHMAYSDIMDYLHGQTMRAILEDDRLNIFTKVASQ